MHHFSSFCLFLKFHRSLDNSKKRNSYFQTWSSEELGGYVRLRDHAWFKGNQKIWHHLERLIYSKWVHHPQRLWTFFFQCLKIIYLCKETLLVGVFWAKFNIYFLNSRPFVNKIKKFTLMVDIIGETKKFRMMLRWNSWGTSIQSNSHLKG